MRRRRSTTEAANLPPADREHPEAEPKEPHENGRKQALTRVQGLIEEVQKQGEVDWRNYFIALAKEVAFLLDRPIFRRPDE